MLEGFPPPQEEEKRLVECYINGEISLEQLGTEIRKDLQTHLPCNTSILLHGNTVLVFPLSGRREKRRFRFRRQAGDI